MSKDIVKDSIKCLANMEIRETTYQVARDVVLDEIERLNAEIELYKDNQILLNIQLNKCLNIIKEATEYIVNKTKDTDFDNDRLIPIYEILQGDNKELKKK